MASHSFFDRLLILQSQLAIERSRRLLAETDKLLPVSRLLPDPVEAPWLEDQRGEIGAPDGGKQEGGGG